ncbi:MAG: hypothetical protein IJP59_10365 [Muribaculaceae bacterium]|nr:hypothetical protein [Muribaculaceae bacterium]
MNKTTKTFLMLVMIALPVICFAQPESCKVTFTGKSPTIKDFARAYCSQFEADSFERNALAAYSKGTYQARVMGGCDCCVVDSKNGYVRFTAFKFGTGGTINQETLEMCYWNCDNKNEKLVAINHIDSSMGFYESILFFYLYNAKTKKMKLIEAPFDREPNAIDLVDQDKADKATIDLVLNSRNEDANKFQPIFSLPREGKDITYRMADPTAIPEAFQRESKLVWDGNGFSPED